MDMQKEKIMDILNTNLLKLEDLTIRLDFMEEIIAKCDQIRVVYTANVTQDLIPGSIYQYVDGVKYSLNSRVGLPEDISLSDLANAWVGQVPKEDQEAFMAFFNREFLLKSYKEGKRRVSIKYWTKDTAFRLYCLEQCVALYRSAATQDIWAIVYGIDTTKMHEPERYTQTGDAEGDARLSVLTFIDGIEKDLFTAHQDEGRVFSAMEKLGFFMKSDKITFWAFDMQGGDRHYIWKAGEKGTVQNVIDDESVRKLRDYFDAENEYFEAKGEDKIKEMCPRANLDGIASIMAVPVNSSSGLINGILIVCNTDNGLENLAILKNLAYCFDGFCLNLKSLQKIQTQRDTDALTGLYNRVRYKSDVLKLFAHYKDELSVVFVDANGLHELNNTQGHDIGDLMLQTIADTLRSNFDTEYIYRYGGDEFVIFAPHATQEELQRQSDALSLELSEYGYSVSVGIGLGGHFKSPRELVSLAEQKMYEAKARYYEKHDRRKRHDASNLSEQEAEKKAEMERMGGILHWIALLNQADSEKELRSMLDDLLCQLGKYAKAERAYIFEKKESSGEDIYSNTYEWCAEGIVPQISELNVIPASAMPKWVDTFEAEKVIRISSLEEVKDTMPLEYEILVPQGIHSLIAVPMTAHHKLYGFIGIDNPDWKLSKVSESLLLNIGIFLASEFAHVYMMEEQKENYRILKEQSGKPVE